VSRAVALVLTGCAACLSKPSIDITVRDANTTDTGAEMMIDADLRPVNIAFVTSTNISIDQLGGIDSADSLCKSLAFNAGLPSNTYRAWLSTTAETARQRLGAARGWVRPDGKPFADEITTLVSGVIYYPLRVTERGDDVVTESVATATTASGGLHANDCSGLVGGTAEQIAIGVSDATTNRWTATSSQSCSTSLRLYCFGTELQQPVSVTPTPGRIAFLSSNAWTPAGKSDADGLCQSEADTNGFGGTYTAFLATSQKSATSNLNLAGAPWVRPDGVPIVASAADLATGQLLAPLNVTAGGTYHDENVWTGLTGTNAVTDTGSLTSTCSDWQSPQGQAAVAFASRTGTAWYRSGTTPLCSEARRLYCFQL
jgi:trimeric autotransporter adhesin